MTDAFANGPRVRSLEGDPPARASRLACFSGKALGIALLGLVACAAGSAEALTDSPRVYDGVDGLTCDYFNLGAGQHWQRRQGDWSDAQGTPYGGAAFAQARIIANNSTQRIEWDVTRVVQGWYADAAANYGFLLRSVPGSPAGIVEFHSREAASPSVRPTLSLAFSDGSTSDVAAAADAVLDCSTYTGLGPTPKIAVGTDRQSVVYFELARSGSAKLSKATLRLTSTDRQYGDVVAGVYQLTPPVGGAGAKVDRGLAAAYVRDEGIERDPDVYMFAGFDVSRWRSAWSHVRESGTFDVVASDAALKFLPLSGKALRVNVAKGDHFGLDMDYAFEHQKGGEPEEVYFRYYLRFADDWSPTLDGGKMPGISGTYDKAGWGNRRSDGTNGWSVRGSFGRWPQKGNPTYGLTSLGTYAYHADMKDFNGEGWGWERSGGALLARNRWYCVEQYVKLNTVGQKDGVMRAWVDGVLVFEKTDIRMRTVPKLRIEKIWMNIYHGGLEPSPHDQHLYIDNVVIARRYIGPMSIPQ